jgi:hypothetical protein
MWKDYNLTSNTYSNSPLAISSWIPMWVGLMPTNNDDSTMQSNNLVNSLENSNLIQAAGILTTIEDSGQQWDSPNSWPPLVLITIEGLRKLPISASQNLANSLSNAWINTNYLAYKENGYMYEKYNAYEIGVGGGGGEYKPQIGFGWSNGVALILLNNTYNNLNSNNDDDIDESFWITALGTTLIIIISSIIIIFIYYLFTNWYKNYQYKQKKNEKNDSNRENPQYAENHRKLSLNLL